MNIVKGIVGVALLIHIILSIPVIMADPALATFVDLLGQRETWGFQIFSDFLLGLILFATMIYFVEGSLKVAALWLVVMFCFGNPATSVYLLLNLNKVQERLSPAAA